MNVNKIFNLDHPVYPLRIHGRVSLCTIEPTITKHSLILYP